MNAFHTITGSLTMTTQHNSEVDLLEFLRMLWDAKWLVIGIAILAVLFSVYRALTATPIYTAVVVVSQVNTDNMGGGSSLAGQFGGLGGLVGLNLKSGGQGREAHAILKSRKLAEKFITRYELLPTLTPQGNETLSMWFGVKRFRELVLNIREDATEGLTTISVDWSDPTVAARWANDYVALANEVIRTRALEESQRNIKYLNERIEQTNVVGVRQVIFNLIESEMKTLMLTNARTEYAFASVDPAVAPEVRSKPKRKLVVASGGALGVVLGVCIVLIRNLVRLIRSKELREQH